MPLAPSKKRYKKNNFIGNAKNIYLIGIKGVGMTALAQILKNRGKRISGSDTKEKFFTDKILKKLGIPFKEGFEVSNLPKETDLVIYSTAFNTKEHPEIIAAKRKKLPVISYPTALGSLFNGELGIAISGTHGKTTTSALVAESMKNLGFGLTALIGSRVNNWGANALICKEEASAGTAPRQNKSHGLVSGWHPVSARKERKKPFFVIEADEHQNKLKFYRPWSIILTNIDYDHPDFYRKESDYYNSFKDWVGKWKKAKFPLPKIGIFNGDDPKIKQLIKELKLKSASNCLVLTYGKEKNCDFRIQNHLPSAHSPETGENKEKISNKINIRHAHKGTITIATNLIGEHNAYNLTAAYAFISALLQITDRQSRITDNKIAKGFAAFAGTERRMQFKGKKGNVLVFDDYAHHPSEIKATLFSLKEAYPRHQLFVIFQPHTYTRTARFLNDFAKSLKIADLIGLLPIYGSAREIGGKVDSKDIQKIIGKDRTECLYFPNHKDCLKFLNNYPLKKPTILVTMGAGDGWRVGEGWLKS